MDYSKFSDQNLDMVEDHFKSGKPIDYSKLSDSELDEVENHLKTASSMPKVQQPVSEQTKPEVSKLESLLRGGAQGATLGFADEGTAILESLLTDKTRQQSLEESRAAYKAAEEANPKSYMAGDIAGNVGLALAPGVGGVGLAGKVLTKLAPKIAANKIALNATSGLISGAGLSGLASIGKSEGKELGEATIDTLKATAEGGAIGGALGGAGTSVVELGKKVAPSVRKFLTGRTAEEVEEIKKLAPLIRQADTVLKEPDAFKKYVSEISDLTNTLHKEATDIGKQADNLLSTEKNIKLTDIDDIIQSKLKETNVNTGETFIPKSKVMYQKDLTEMLEDVNKKYGGDKINGIDMISEKEYNDISKMLLEKADTFYDLKQKDAAKFFNSLHHDLKNPLKERLKEKGISEYSDIRLKQEDLINKAQDLQKLFNLQGKKIDGERIFRPTDTTVTKTKGLISPEKFEARNKLETIAQDNPQYASELVDKLKGMVLSNKIDKEKFYNQGATMGLRMGLGAAVGGMSGGSFDPKAAAVGAGVGMLSKPISTALLKRSDTITNFLTKKPEFQEKLLTLKNFKPLMQTLTQTTNKAITTKPIVAAPVAEVASQHTINDDQTQRHNEVATTMTTSSNPRLQKLGTTLKQAIDSKNKDLQTKTMFILNQDKEARQLMGKTEE